MNSYLDPVALGGSPTQAWASHEARAAGIAKYFAANNLLADVHGDADENKMNTLLAHLAAAKADPNFQVYGVESRLWVPVALQQLRIGAHIGTAAAGFHGNYDFAVKHLMTIACRYGHLLDPPGSEPGSGISFILTQLVPTTLRGSHDPSIEVAKPFGPISVPETENHLLMIETSRYLMNQLCEPIDEPVSAHQKNLTDWLLRYLQNIAQHDFLEFGSRPYGRMSLHSLLNLYEFAREPLLRTAAQNILDYQFTKCALSANRGRRVNPYRRHQHRINHAANYTNDLYAERCDTVTSFFLAYTGMTDEEGAPAPFPAGKVYEAVIAGTSTYRPPAVAYQLALERDVPPHLHRFYHGIRPELPASGNTADAGVEIYYQSPSFMLTAGGCFLNSGYGSDEVDAPGKYPWNETSRAQSTTLIPTRALHPPTSLANKGSPLQFRDLIRFDPFGDPQVNPEFLDQENGESYHTRAVNMGVNRGIAAGANPRPARYKVVLEHFISESPALAFHNGRLYVAWKGRFSKTLSVAKVVITTAMGMDGVEGVEGVVKLDGTFTSDAAPALASHNGRLWLAWRGSGNKQLNLAFSDDNGAHFHGTRTFADASEHAPALASHAGRLYLAWTGLDERLNVAKSVLFASTAGAFGIDGLLEDHVVLDESSKKGPALASHNNRLWLAWRGSGNEQLNLAFSDDNGAHFHGTRTFADASEHAPALASHAGRLYLAWTGLGHASELNVARVTLLGNTAGAFGIDGQLEGKITFTREGSLDSPALGASNDMLCLVRNGFDQITTGDIELDYGRMHFHISRDGSFGTPYWQFPNLAHFGLYVAMYMTPAADGHCDLGIFYAAESAGTDYDTFREAVQRLNSHLPLRLEFGKSYEFYTPDGGRFSCSFDLLGDKYAERVVNLDDPVNDFKTLPLVSGEYLRATGHTGHIEIWSPGRKDVAAVVLDFQNHASPERIDNEATWPELQLDRASAAMEFADHSRTLSANLASSAQAAEAVEPAQTAVDVLAGFTPPPVVRTQYLATLASARRDLVTRLTAAKRADQARAAARETIQAYRDVAGTVDAD
ncbi:hypothetical protein, partial [Streptomyces sp. NPDC002215]|uniref:hypothetical protein n=1 Tax=Streptomyces sp. NPDC002215 TaxID=3154412 RepID=UPI00331D69F1